MPRSRKHHGVDDDTVDAFLPNRSTIIHRFNHAMMRLPQFCGLDVRGCLTRSLHECLEDSAKLRLFEAMGMVVSPIGGRDEKHGWIQRCILRTPLFLHEHPDRMRARTGQLLQCQDRPALLEALTDSLFRYEEAARLRQEHLRTLDQEARDALRPVGRAIAAFIALRKAKELPAGTALRHREDTIQKAFRVVTDVVQALSPEAYQKIDLLTSLTLETLEHVQAVDALAHDVVEEAQAARFAAVAETAAYLHQKPLPLLVQRLWRAFQAHGPKTSDVNVRHATATLLQYLDIMQGAVDKIAERTRLLVYRT